MTGKTIQLTQISIDDLSCLIREAVAGEIKKLNCCVSTTSSQSEDVLLTRKQTSEMLNVSYTTLFHWNNDEILSARKLGRKVFYLKEDVINKLKNAA